MSMLQGIGFVLIIFIFPLLQYYLLLLLLIIIIIRNGHAEGFGLIISC